MKHSEYIDKIAAALAKAQGEIDGAKKTATNPAFRSKYADLAGCVEACRDSLTQHGIAVLQMPQPCDDGVILVTMLAHASGQWIADGGLHVPANKKDAQGFGSALTYARRYGLCAMVGIAPEDDDGNAAVKSHKPAKPEPKSISPTAGVRDGLTETEQQFFREHAEEISAFIERGLAADAVAYVQAQGFTAEEFTTVWTYMSAPIRSKYKAAKSLATANKDA